MAIAMEENAKERTPYADALMDMCRNIVPYKIVSQNPKIMADLAFYIEKKLNEFEGKNLLFGASMNFLHF